MGITTRKASIVTTLSLAPNSKSAPDSSAAPNYETESDVFDLAMDDADTLRAGEFLHFRRSFKGYMRTLQIRKIVKYNMVVEEDTKLVLWKVYFNSPPDDEQYVTTLLARGGRRFQKVGTMQYAPLFRYNFVHCIERNSWDITWEE